MQLQRRCQHPLTSTYGKHGCFNRNFNLWRHRVASKRFSLYDVFFAVILAYIRNRVCHLMGTWVAKQMPLVYPNHSADWANKITCVVNKSKQHVIYRWANYRYWLCRLAVDGILRNIWTPKVTVKMDMTSCYLNLYLAKNYSNINGHRLNLSAHTAAI